MEVQEVHIVEAPCRMACSTGDKGGGCCCWEVGA